jgi:hypothetical protein
MGQQMLVRMGKMENFLNNLITYRVRSVNVPEASSSASNRKLSQ